MSNTFMPLSDGVWSSVMANSVKAVKAW